MFQAAHRLGMLGVLAVLSVALGASPMLSEAKAETVKGKVVRKSTSREHPLKGAALEFCKGGSKGCTAAFTGNRGQFYVKNLAAGSYTLKVRSRNGQRFRKKVRIKPGSPTVLRVVAPR